MHYHYSEDERSFERPLRFTKRSKAFSVFSGDGHRALEDA